MQLCFAKGPLHAFEAFAELVQYHNKSNHCIIGSYIAASHPVVLGRACLRLEAVAALQPQEILQHSVDICVIYSCSRKASSIQLHPASGHV